jgi:asparagine synthetase B (glutamine-hydrolysing)
MCDRAEEVKKGNSKAKSYDYGLITSAVSKVDPHQYRTNEWVQVESKVVFSGLGADEVFGGYARYKTAFERGGVQEMEQEMGMDLDRLWHRNMGRDDRAISDNGKETRFPFIDTNLMRYLGGFVHSADLVDFTALRGLGDKMLLREIAREEFGI